QTAARGAPQPAPPGTPFTARVVEIARSVDLARGGREWLGGTRGGPGAGAGPRPGPPPPPHLRPAGDARATHAHAPVRGGTAREDPAVLRFQAGFPLPPAAVKKVSLTLLLPRPRAPGSVAFAFQPDSLARLPATARTAEGAITVLSATEQPYVPPELPGD